jgi:uncharacterized protein (TIGR02588 family)
MVQQSNISKSSSQNHTSPHQKNKRQPGELWEELLGGVGLILVIGVISFLLYQASQPNQPPALAVQAEQTIAQENGYLVQIRVTNQGDETASSALVEGTLVDASGNTVESSDITFDYIPPRSQRHAGLVFQSNPNEYQLELQFRGYVEP